MEARVCGGHENGKGLVKPVFLRKMTGVDKFAVEPLHNDCLFLEPRSFTLYVALSHLPLSTVSPHPFP